MILPMGRRGRRPVVSIRPSTLLTLKPRRVRPPSSRIVNTKEDDRKDKKITNGEVASESATSIFSGISRRAGASC